MFRRINVATIVGNMVQPLDHDHANSSEKAYAVFVHRTDSTYSMELSPMTPSPVENDKRFRGHNLEMKSQTASDAVEVQEVRTLTVALPAKGKSDIMQLFIE